MKQNCLQKAQKLRTGHLRGGVKKVCPQCLEVILVVTTSRQKVHKKKSNNKSEWSILQSSYHTSKHESNFWSGLINHSSLSTKMQFPWFLVQPWKPATCFHVSTLWYCVISHPILSRFKVLISGCLVPATKPMCCFYFRNLKKRAPLEMQLFFLHLCVAFLCKHILSMCKQHGQIDEQKLPKRHAQPMRRNWPEIGKAKIGKKKHMIAWFLHSHTHCLCCICLYLVQKNCKTCAKKEVRTWTFCGSKILLILGIP